MRQELRGVKSIQICVSCGSQWRLAEMKESNSLLAYMVKSQPINLIKCSAFILTFFSLKDGDYIPTYIDTYGNFSAPTNMIVLLLKFSPPSSVHG